MQIAAYISILLLIREIGLCLPHQRWLLALPIIAVAGFEAGLGVVQHTLNIEGGIATGTYVNQDHFAFLLEMVLPFAVMYGIAIARQRDARSRLSVVDALKAGVAFCLGGLMLASIVYSLSRAGLVAAMASLGAVAAATLWSRLQQYKFWVRCSAEIGIIALFLIGIVLLSPASLTARYAQTFISEPRFAIWRDALHMLAAFPLFGCGLGGFGAGFVKFQTAAVDWSYDFAHNDYLQLITELGFVGFLIPATLTIAVTVKSLHGVRHHKRGRYLAIACFGSLTAILVHSLVDFNLYIQGNAMVAFWVFGICAGLAGSSNPPVPHSAAWLRQFSIASSCSLIVYSSAFLLLDLRLRGDFESKNMLCRFGICQGFVVVPEDPQSRATGASEYAAATGLRQALFRDPAAPHVWCDLGDTLRHLGQIDLARRCFARARILGPNVPPTLFKEANFYFADGNKLAALSVTAHVLAITSSFDDSIFKLYDTSGVGVDEVLLHGLPDDRRAARAYFHHILECGDLGGAKKTWGWIASRHFADDRLADEYLRCLAKNGDYKRAAQAWASYLGDRGNAYLKSNWVFNGDFELEPTGMLFDWKMEGKEADVARDANVAHSGSQSMSIRFHGTENVDFAGLHQTVYVEPGRYRLEAFVRTENIDTDQGIEFHIFDLENAARLDAKTEQILGTTDWRMVERTFEVHPETHVVEIQIVRERSRKFDSKISGAAWVDSVRLERKTPQ